LADKQTTRILATRASQLMQEAQEREEQLDAQLTRVIPPSTEALAAEANAMVAAAPVVPAEVPPVPAVVVNSHEAEDAELKKVGVTVSRDASGKPTRYSQIYQVVDEDGTTIGRPTNLSAATLVELMAKQKEVHTQATRAFHRLKRQKLTQKAEKHTVLTPEQISEAAKIALEEKDASKVEDVIKATIETAYKTREEETRKKELREEGRAISNEFMRRHLHDYNPCDANKKAMAEYFVEHNLDFTLDNLEVAFVDLMDQGGLVTVSTKTHVSEPANPDSTTASTAAAAPVIPVAEVPAAAPVSAATATAQPAAPSQPAVEATATTSAAAPNVQPAARRPGVGGSIAPGSLSAQRPGAPDPALARKEFLRDYQKQTPDEMRRRLKDPKYAAQLRAYGVKV
jgi:predicted SnoaL-like aldol condensation-catalyzing enzyme